MGKDKNQRRHRPKNLCFGAPDPENPKVGVGNCGVRIHSLRNFDAHLAARRHLPKRRVERTAHVKARKPKDDGDSKRR